MIVYEAIKSMDKGVLKAFVKAGLISMNTERNLQIYEMIEAYKKTGHSLTMACILVQDYTCVQDRMIFNIYKKMSSEVD